jgi:hypothetical protein
VHCFEWGSFIQANEWRYITIFLANSFFHDTSFCFKLQMLNFCLFVRCLIFLLGVFFFSFLFFLQHLNKVFWLYKLLWLVFLFTTHTHTCARVNIYCDITSLPFRLIFCWVLYGIMSFTCLLCMLNFVNFDSLTVVIWFIGMWQRPLQMQWNCLGLFTISSCQFLYRREELHIALSRGGAL